MKSFKQRFQRIPSDVELDNRNALSYTNDFQRDFRSDFQSSPSLTEYSNVQYDAVRRQDDQVRATNWASSRLVKTLGFISHLILTLMPIAFIALAFLALSVDGETLSHRGSVIFQAAKLGPSIFPIVFAAVVGRLMRTMALWRAERGSTIGLLEQLNGSQNFLAALERSLLLPSLWAWSAAIIVLWGLSPLGGQSSLRILEIRQSGNAFNQDLYYINTDNYSQTIFAGASYLDYGLPAVQAIYQACLLAPVSVASGSGDIWGNTKIPFLQAQSAYTGSADQDWISIEHDNNTIYSSLTGIITSGLIPDTSANFTIETSYLNFTCPDPVVFGDTASSESESSANSTNVLEEFRDWLGDVVVHTNRSRSPFSSGREASNLALEWNSFMIDSNFNNSDPEAGNTKLVNLIYASQNTDVSQIVTAYNCSVGFSHVESGIGCNGTTCQVQRMRPSRVFTNSSVSTPWNQPDSLVPFSNFLYQFPWMSGQVHDGEVNPADFYVSGNNTPFQPPGIFGVNYTSVTGIQVAQRLGALVNTVWQSSIAQSYIARPPQSDFNATASSNYPFTARSAAAIMQTNEYVYHANRLWVGLTATISLILFICGVAGMIFRYITKAPDILGYVSTMTRDNPYFNDTRTHGADRLDGLERARLLRDAVVQISNVRPSHDATVHIALKSVAHGESRKSTRLNKSQRSSGLATPI